MLYCILIFVFELTCVVPSAPDIKATWRNQFASILTSFITVRSHRNLICHSALPVLNSTILQEQFYISDGIDGSAANYTITYSESTSGKICDCVTISTSESACISGQCNHMFDTSACSDFTSITITVFATNVLGDGPSSKQVLSKLNYMNQR